MYKKDFVKTYIIRKPERLLQTSPCLYSRCSRGINNPSTAWPKTYLNEFLALNKPALSNQLFIQEGMWHPNTLKKFTQPEPNGNVRDSALSKEPREKPQETLQNPK